MDEVDVMGKAWFTIEDGGHTAATAEDQLQFRHWRGLSKAAQGGLF
jgi:hypothetical protein